MILIYLFVRALFYLFVGTVALIGICIALSFKILDEVIELIAERRKRKRQAQNARPQSYYSNRR